MAKNEIQTIGGIILFGIIILLLASGGVFSAIFKAFNDPVFGGFGALLGLLFILIIILTFIQKILGK